ncbi:MAG: hypothetical protein NVS4B11_21240 [Ktedonobacteraceae bacterium]
MGADNKKIMQETSRWLRVGFLTISVVGPAINVIASRLRERTAILREEAAKRGSIAYTQSQERLTTAGASLAESLNELKAHPYSQGLLERGSNLTEDFVDRGSKLSHVVTKRSEQVGRDLAERGGKATQLVVERSSDVLQELAQRSEQASQKLAKRREYVSKEITKRSAKVSKEVTKRSQKAAKDMRKRSQKAQHEIAKRAEQLTQQNSRQNSPFWAVFSFSMGLTAAGVATYLIKKRLQQNEQASQQAHIALNGALNGPSKSTTSGEARSVSQPSFAVKTAEAPTITAPTLTPVEPIIGPIIAEPELEESESATEKMPSISIKRTIKAQPTIEETPLQATEAVTSDEHPAAEHPIASETHTETQAQNVPTAIIIDATFIGIVSTKHYYPVETPLNELSSPEDGSLDVIYFVTEDEAKAQGYTTAL